MGDYRHFNNQHFRICRFGDVWRNINVHPFRHLSTIFINGDKIQSMTKIARKCQWLAIVVWKSFTILVINRFIHPSFHYNPSQNNKYNKTAESWPSNFDLLVYLNFEISTVNFRGPPICPNSVWKLPRNLIAVRKKCKVVNLNVDVLISWQISLLTYPVYFSLTYKTLSLFESNDLP